MNDDQKYGQKRLARRYGTITLSSRSRQQKNNKASWKNVIENNEQTVFHRL